MVRIMVAALLLLEFLQGYSTCIVIIKRENSILIGADSRRNFFTSDGQHWAQSVCKINSISNQYFAISGHDDGALYSNIIESLKGKFNWRDGVAEFVPKMIAYYTKSLKFIKAADPKFYSYLLINHIAGIAFFGFENHKPYLQKLVFRALEDPNGQILVKTFIINTDAEVIALGFSDHIDELEKIKSNKMVSKGSSDSAKIDRYINYEIIKHPEDIGLPIDILQLTDKGARWLKRKKKCSTDIPYSNPK